MSTAAPEQFRRDVRPPTSSDAAPPSGAAAVLRPSARQRPWITPSLWHDPLATLGYAPDHPYVRRFWTAAIGPGAVADLLRLAAAAHRGRAIRLPVHLAALARNDLVRAKGNAVAVRATVPPLPAVHAGRLPRALREEHRSLRWSPHRID